MDDQVDIIAGETLKALWGHTIMVDGQYMRIGADGRLTVKPAIAQRLLKQSGWAKVDAMQSDVGEKLDTADEGTAEPTPTELPCEGGKKRKKRR